MTFHRKTKNLPLCLFYLQSFKGIQACDWRQTKKRIHLDGLCKKACLKIWKAKKMLEQHWKGYYKAIQGCTDYFYRSWFLKSLSTKTKVSRRKRLSKMRTRLGHSITLHNIMSLLQAGKEANLWIYCLKGGFRPIMHKCVRFGLIHSCVGVVWPRMRDKNCFYRGLEFYGS